MWKNNLIVNMILETHSKFDVVFIQEPSWSSICAILSSKSRDGKELVGVPNHPNWLVFMNSSSNIHDYPRVITYVNIRLSSFCFSLCKDVLNHRDISLISFFINNNIFFPINIYSDSLQSVLKYLKDTEVDIPNTLTCYELKSLELDERTTLVLSNTRELDRELFYKLVYLI